MSSSKLLFINTTSWFNSLLISSEIGFNDKESSTPLGLPRWLIKVTLLEIFCSSSIYSIDFFILKLSKTVPFLIGTFKSDLINTLPKFLDVNLCFFHIPMDNYSILSVIFKPISNFFRHDNASMLSSGTTDCNTNI